MTVLIIFICFRLKYLNVCSIAYLKHTLVLREPATRPTVSETQKTNEIRFVNQKILGLSDNKIGGELQRCNFSDDRIKRAYFIIEAKCYLSALLPLRCIIGTKVSSFHDNLSFFSNYKTNLDKAFWITMGEWSETRWCIRFP